MAAKVATPTIPIPTPEVLDATIEQLRARIAAIPDDDEMPRSWPERLVNAAAEESQLCARYLDALRSERAQLPQLETKRAEINTDITRLLRARKSLRRQLAQLADTDISARRDLEESILVIERGCEYAAGHPQLPPALRELLTERCEACQHAELRWSGRLARHEMLLADVEQEIARLQHALSVHVRDARIVLEKPSISAHLDHAPAVATTT